MQFFLYDIEMFSTQNCCKLKDIKIIKNTRKNLTFPKSPELYCKCGDFHFGHYNRLFLLVLLLSDIKPFVPSAIYPAPEGELSHILIEDRMRRPELRQARKVNNKESEQRRQKVLSH